MAIITLTLVLMIIGWPWTFHNGQNLSEGRVHIMGTNHKGRGRKKGREIGGMEELGG